MRRFLLALSLIVVALPAAAQDFPPLTGRVVDAAELLSPEAEAYIGRALADHEGKTGEQVVVATLASLHGQDIAEYGYQLGRHWGIGREGKNDGALLIVAPNDRKVRIEVGYGLEGRLTDARSRHIIDSAILPAFRDGQMERGVVDGSLALLQALGAAPTPASGQAASQSRNEDEANWPAAGMIGLFFGLVFLMRRQKRRHGWTGYHGAPVTHRGGGFPGSGGGGGGFSGGGGSFGGGGASGGW